MKTYYPYLFLSTIIFLVIIISVTSSIDKKTYYTTSITGSPYEGFTGSSILDYSSTTDNASMDTLQSYLIESGSQKDCKKVYGFDGLFCKPYIADNKLDIFNNATGSLSCESNGSGLSNSKGSLCLDKTMTKLLMSRGGNALGGGFQIGQ